MIPSSLSKTVRLTACAAAAMFTLSTPAAHAQAVAFRTLHQFTDGADGYFPYDRLVVGQDGNLYGVSSGGERSQGLVFKVTPTGAFTVVHNFDKYVAGSNDGAYPQAGLALGKDGNLYGTTEHGGTDDQGIIFKLTPAGILTVLHSFDKPNSNGANQDGAFVESVLAQGSDGNFYGTATEGGANRNGTIFKVTPAGVFTVLHTFSALDDHYNNSDGTRPLSPLIEGGSGDFYGTASSGGALGGDDSAGEGTFFKITTEGTFTKLKDFLYKPGENNVGTFPRGPLALGKDGNFYGAAASGGFNVDSYNGLGAGTLFRVTPGGGYTVLHDFDVYTYPGGRFVNKQGGASRGGLILGQDGNFYGTGYLGGTNSYGTVYQLKANGTFTVLHTFSATERDTGKNTDGSDPSGALVEAGKGNFYGVTSTGGVNNRGVIYEVTFGPLVTSAPTAGATVGKPFSYTITARNNATVFGVLGLPTGLKVEASTGVISGTPTTAGTFHPTLQAANAYGKNPATLTLTILAAGPPAITSAGSAAATKGQPFNYQIAATNDPKSFGAVGLPAGLKVDAKSGLISGTPTGSGKKTVTLKAINNAGTGTLPLTLTIAP